MLVQIKLALPLLGMLLVAASPTPAAAPKPLAGLADFKQEWEVGWTADWRLVKAREEEIDHFIYGYALRWERTLGERRWTRSDTFTKQWRFNSAYEELRENGRLVSRGPVIITQDGIPLFRIVVYLGKPIRNDFLHNYEFLYYGLHLLERQYRGCVFRSDT